jgi:hypothetical protein
MNNEAIQPKGITDRPLTVARILECLYTTWEYYGRLVHFVIQPGDWIKDYPDLLQILDQAAKREMINLWPNKEVEDNKGGYNPQEVALRPSTLKLLKSRVREAKRRANRKPLKRLDPRNRKGALIQYGNIHGLAIDAVSWLNNLRDPFAKKANGSERMLQDLIGHRYDDLKSNYPELLEEIKKALTTPRSFRETSCGV